MPLNRSSAMAPQRLRSEVVRTDPGVLSESGPFFLNSINVDWAVFVQASRQDYRLKNPAKPLLKPCLPAQPTVWT